MRTIFKAVFVTFCLSTAVPALAIAEQPENRESAYGRHDYTAALRLLRPLAEHGDAPAQYNLGVMLRDGQGVPQDLAGAAMWFRKAAQQGLTDLQYNLGAMLLFGQGVPQDPAAAERLFRGAAAQGMALAQL